MNALSAPHGRSPALDALRAGAAALVLLSHARSLVFRDAEPGLSWPAALFYGVSGLGHQAVIVFFALSGLVVTTSMLRLAASGRWSLPRFAKTRLVRLWIVLLPCLLGGAMLDRLGLALAMPPYGIPAVSHPAPPIDLGLGTALGNLLFLQTIAVPVLGSNGPLWSLANEAWYYVLAGFGFAAWQARRRPGIALGFAGAALVGAPCCRPPSWSSLPSGASGQAWLSCDIARERSPLRGAVWQAGSGSRGLQSSYPPLGCIGAWARSPPTSRSEPRLRRCFLRCRRLAAERRVVGPQSCAASRMAPIRSTCLTCPCWL